MWSPREGRLYWFDIKGRRLSWYEPEVGHHGHFELPMRASVAAPRAAGGLIVATEKGLAAFDPVSGSLEIAQRHEFELGFRTNDGKVDPAGNLWWSIMDDEGGRRPGALYRTTPDWRTEKMLEGVHIANTVCWSPDGARFYLADSKLDTIYALDAERLENRQVFAHTRDEAGSPDGAAVDADGYLWNAQWGGWRIVRYAPDGTVDRVVPVPVEQPTSCAFGGEDLSTLYVTSAWDELSDDARAAQPLAGGLFAFEPGVKGLPLPMFAG